MSVVWQEEASDPWNGSYPKVVVANKINGTWNAQTTLATSARNSSLAQGEIYQSLTTGSDAIVAWSGVSTPLIPLFAIQKTNGGSRPPKDEELTKSEADSIPTIIYQRGVNLNLSDLLIPGLKGLVTVLLEESSDRKFESYDGPGELKDKFFTAKTNLIATNSLYYSINTLNVSFPQPFNFQDRNTELFSLSLLKKNDAKEKIHTISLGDLMNIWSSDKKNIDSCELGEYNVELVLSSSDIVNLKINPLLLNDTAKESYIEIITTNGQSSLKKKQIKTFLVNSPSDYALDQNYPNPFNPNTTISYSLPKDGIVVIKIYDALGREVRTLVNEFKSTGRYTADFDASRLASGIYIYKLVSGDYSAVKKMILLK
ncbi:MAG: T9SS type A sorting domain-containing protein [Ignavibacteriales bacterium]|nr:T9SS type A sorting domain-containing protein [Ignavibacteriales bacterium]